MIPRMLKLPGQSFFLFGPRGTGKSSWVKSTLKGALYFDLLDHPTYLELAAGPERLESLIPSGHQQWVVLDEVQKVPALLDAVHRLIENRRVKFVLTGSSARSLKRKGVNLLAGRALTKFMHPLTAAELGESFDLKRALKFGGLPLAVLGKASAEFLASYVVTYLKEEVQQEGLTRNVGGFSKFLEVAAFSQASVLNVAEVARECAVDRKTAENYFQILEDLLLAERVPVFTRRARRDLVTHAKFYYFDVGVFRTLRRAGPLDRPEEVDGAALETLVYQELRALNDYAGLGYRIHFWRTRGGHEVDFVLYGERGLQAIEVKRSSRIRGEDLAGLKAFKRDYPEAKCYLLYGGERRREDDGIVWLPLIDTLPKLGEFL